MSKSWFLAKSTHVLRLGNIKNNRHNWHIKISTEDEWTAAESFSPLEWNFFLKHWKKPCGFYAQRSRHRTSQIIVKWLSVILYIYILLKCVFFPSCKSLQTRFWFLTNDSWQYSQFTFLQEHSNVTWMFRSCLVSFSVQPEFGHCTTLKGHSDWCFLKYKII